ncbi:MAG TPA: BTAD domain-containing putative transcriptional regulator [Longimicrobium sp.]|nr:BTAD domain-containing putative transcriptional regulator [Longimicrobium sp.]
MSATFGILFESDKEMTPAERTFLRTLGHPVLRRGDGSVVEGLRRKDLALVAYLCVEGDRPFSRSHLAALLWGESPEEKARHSLTQALRRAGAAVGRRALIMERDTVRWTGAAACDAQLLLEGDERLDELLTIYEGPFLEGFEAGFGSQEFSAWADARRAELRRAAVRWLDRAGESAERERDWERALRLGERLVQIDREWEGGHRRVMRALLERGERNLALRHFREFARWLTYEVGGQPDPETMALADLIRATACLAAPAPPAQAPPERISAASPSAAHPPLARVDHAAPTDALPAPSAHPALEDAPPADGAADEGDGSARASSMAEPGSPPRVALPPPDGPAAVPGQGRATPALPDAAAALLAPFAGDDAEADARMERSFRRFFAVAAVVALAMLAAGPRTGSLHPAVGNGEVVQAPGEALAYLVFGDTLWGFPDAATQERCLGVWPRVRRVRALPPWPRRTLPSVRTHPWLGGNVPVESGDPARGTRYVSLGCVLAPVPDSLTHAVIFGTGARIARAPRALLQQLPHTAQADAFPSRAPGTLIQGAGDSIRWVAFHGGALALRHPAVLGSYCRAGEKVVRVPENEFRYYAPHADLPQAAGPCAADRRHPTRSLNQKH